MVDLIGTSGGPNPFNFMQFHVVLGEIKKNYVDTPFLEVLMPHIREILNEATGLDRLK